MLPGNSMKIVIATYLLKLTQPLSWIFSSSKIGNGGNNVFQAVCVEPCLSSVDYRKSVFWCLLMDISITKATATVTTTTITSTTTSVTITILSSRTTIRTWGTTW